MLLDDAGIAYTNRGRGKHTLLGKYIYAIWILVVLLIALMKFRPSIAMSLSSPYLVLLTRILGITCVTYDDTDYNPRLLPLIKKSKYLLTPATYPHRFHGGHFHVPALKELAYLHPAQFKHDQDRAGVFFRITRTDSIHHSLASRLELEPVLKKIEQLSQTTPLFLSTETDLDHFNNKFCRKSDPIHIHRDLASCSVFWGNSATMAAEAAVLGIPAIFVSAEKFAYIAELEAYGLLYHFHPEDLHSSLKKLDTILEGTSQGNEFLNARDLLLREKIDMMAFMVWFIETLPESARILEEDPDYIQKFIAGR